jgi:hypothetical protein
MIKLIGERNIKIIYDEHDPNLVQRRCADVTLMRKYLGSHTISVDEGVRTSCRELYDKVDKWRSHNV